jgi:tetratricopeptide (TPR) repeat protein
MGCRLDSLLVPALAFVCMAGALPILAQPVFPPPRACAEPAAASDVARQALDMEAATTDRLMNQGRAGFVKFAIDIAEHACQSADRPRLDALFQRCMRECVEETDRYFAHVEYGAALERFGDDRAAETVFQQAIKLRGGLPDGLVAYNRYALLLYRLGRTREALDLLNRLDPDELRPQSSVAQIKEGLMRELNLRSVERAVSPASRAPDGATGLRTDPTP